MTFFRLSWIIVWYVIAWTHSSYCLRFGSSP